MSLELRRRLQVLGDRVRARRGVPLECLHTDVGEGRDSPHRILRFSVGGREAMVCHGQPSARGRAVFGDLVPWDQLWRAGANEPTTLYLPFAATVAGLDVSPGLYALYLVPSRDQSRVVLNRSFRQSGRTREETGRRGNVFPSAYSPFVARCEVGRAPISTAPCEYCERLVITSEEASIAETLLHLAWERTRFSIPLRTAG